MTITYSNKARLKGLSQTVWTVSNTTMPSFQFEMEKSRHGCQWKHKTDAGYNAVFQVKRRRRKLIHIGCLCSSIYVGMWAWRLYKLFERQSKVFHRWKRENIFSENVKIGDVHSPMSLNRHHLWYVFLNVYLKIRSPADVLVFYEKMIGCFSWMSWH